MKATPPIPDHTPAIELHGLGRRYGRTLVLRNINLSVTRGRLVLLRGDNGAGKTTLLRVLATRLRPSRGSGKILGFDLVKQAHRIRRHIAFLSVLGGSYPTLTAAENLQLAAIFYGRRRPPIDELLERVDLLRARDKLVRTFSSGMKKRLGVARLLLSDAELWLLDEPYAALDEAGKELIDELLELAETQGRTVMMASHEVLRSRPFSGSVLEIVAGSVRNASSPPEVARV